jgi:hypothetical protein
MYKVINVLNDCPNLNDGTITYDVYTHIGLYRPKNKYYINIDRIDAFWGAYISEISKKKKNYLAEKPDKNCMPILADLDLKIQKTDGLDINDDDGTIYSDDGSQRVLYTEENIIEVVGIYQDIIKKLITNLKEEHNVCLVLEKRARLDGTSIKKGFHLHFPCIFLSASDQSKYILPEVRRLIKEKGLFTYVDNYENIVDSSVYSNNWLLYGSCKGDNDYPYEVTKIYDHNTQEIDLYDALNNYQIFDSQNNSIDMSQDIDKYLPRVLSVINQNRSEYIYKIRIPSIVEEKRESSHSHIKKRRQTVESVAESLVIADKLINMMDVYRSINYTDWRNVCFALSNIGKGSEEAYNLWIKFSERAGDKFDEASCINLWEKSDTDGRFSLGTLRWLAKKDNVKEYNKYNEERFRSRIKKKEQEKKIEHYDFAKELYEDLGDVYVATNSDSKSWYMFDGHSWKNVGECKQLREYISEHFSVCFQNSAAEIRKKMLEDEDVDTKKLNKRIEFYNSMSGKCKNNPFKNHIMKEAASSTPFLDETFVDKNMQKETILLEQWNIEKRRNNFKNKSFVGSENNNHSIVEKESLPKEILVKEANTAIYKAWVEISSRSLNDLLDLINFQNLDGFFF